MSDSFLSRSYFDAVYIPAGLIVVGTAILKTDYVPYACALALALGSYRFYDMREFTLCAKTRDALTDARSSTEEGPQGERVPGV